MPRIRLLAGALALAIVSTAAQAQSFSNVIGFGDSVSDAGQYVGLVPGAQGSFTTNPDPVWLELVGANYGFDVTPSNFGGFDYAYGGAQTHDPAPLGIPGPFCVAQISLPCVSMTTQLGLYFHDPRVGGVADRNALYSVFGGANDLFFNGFRGGLPSAHPFFITPAQAAANMQVSAVTEVGLIKALQDAGARYILVFNLPDIGRAPGFVGTGSAAGATSLTLVFNSTLNAGLGTLGDGIIPIDSFGLFNEVLADPSAYGFSNVTDQACLPEASAVYCTTSTLVAPGANDTYLFADGPHPTGAGHRLIAQQVLAELQAPGQISMLGEAPLQVFETNSRALGDQMLADMSRKRADGSLRAFASFDYSRQRYDATVHSPQTSSNNSTLTLGGDYYFNDSISVGLATSLAHQDANFAGGGGYRNLEPLYSAYGVWRGGDAYLSLIGSVGQLNFNDVTRSFRLGAATRTEAGNAGGSHTGVEIGGGYFFHWGDLKTGPFASYAWQKVKVDSYFENNGDSSSMSFGRQNRKSGIAKIGWQLGGDMKMGDSNLHPFARVAYQHESQTTPAPIEAGLVSMNGRFTLPGFQPDKNWLSGELGLSAELGDHLSAYGAYSGRFGDSNQRIDSVNLGLSYTF